MDRPLRALVVEDSADDAELMLRELRRDGYSVTFERVDTPQAMSAALDGETWDIVLSDHSMPQFSAPAALRLLRDSGLDLPFIIVSGAIGEEGAVAAMRAGAHDYISKDNLARLTVAVERETREAEIRRRHRINEDKELRLHRELEENQLELQHRLNQINALNRLFQEHLSQRSEVVEAYNDLLEVLQKHMEDTSELVARARSQPMSNLHDPATEEGGGVTSSVRSGTHVELQPSLQPTTEKLPSLSEGSIPADVQQEPATQRIRVLIADGDDSVRRSVHGMLERADVVSIAGEIRDGEKVIDHIRSLTPDVVLLDVQTPGFGGIAILNQLRETDLQTRVILMTSHAGGHDVLEGLRAGARGYLLKEAGIDELMRAILTVHEGGLLLQPAMAKRLIESLDADDAPGLTPRELEVLQLLASGARNREIAEQLSLSVNTVKYHIENLYEKLGVRSRTQAVRVAGERGLSNL